MEDQNFKLVTKVIEELWNDGIVQRGAGHCIAMSDIVHKLLDYYGIESYLQECSLLIKQKNVDDLILVGYSLAEVNDKVSQVKTHVVCITKTEKPILIDLSVYNFVNGVPYICDYVSEDKPVEKFDFPNGKFIYTKKYTDYQLPLLHEKSIIDRIKTDKNIFDNFKKINSILILISIVTTINFFRGWYDFGQKYIIKDNNFGPNKTLVK